MIFSPLLLPNMDAKIWLNAHFRVAGETNEKLNRKGGKIKTSIGEPEHLAMSVHCQCWQSNRGCDKYPSILASHFQKVAWGRLLAPCRVQHRVISYLLLAWALFQQIARGTSGVPERCCPPSGWYNFYAAVWPKCVSKENPGPIRQYFFNHQRAKFIKGKTSLFMRETPVKRVLPCANFWTFKANTSLVRFHF